MMFSKFKNFVRVMMAVGQWDHRYPRITIDTEIRRSGRVASKEGTFNNTEGERIDETMSQRNESIGSQLHMEEDEEDISSEADSHNVSDRGGNSINGAASDSSVEESEHDVDGDGGDEMILHPGFLEFLSRQRNDSIQRLNSIVQQLRGSQVHCRKRCYFDDENHNRACCHCDNEIDDTATPSMPLCQIRLIRDQIRDEGIIRIADAMEEGCSCCPYNNLNNYNDDKKMKTSSYNSRGLIQMPCSCPTRYLSEINLSMSHIGDLGVCSLAHAISKACLPSLHSVDVSSNNITGIGVICLANCSLSFGGVYDNETGSNQPRIEKLCLSSNEIGSLGASALANALCGYRSKCGFSSEDGEKNVTTHVEFDGSPASIAVPGPRGICSLKTLSLSQCKLNDCDATVFGEALLPHRDAAPIHFGVKRQESPRGSACKQETHEVKIGTKKFRNDYSLPSQPESHSLKKLHLYGNLITLAGMEFLHSVIHSCGQASALEDLQSLYSQSNHMIDIGVIIDHGTQDDHIGPFFNQEEDNKLISSIRDMKSIERLRKNATTITPAGHQIASVADKDGDNPKELQELLIKKMILKDSIARDLAINIQCAQHISLSRMSPFLNRPLHFDDARRITRRILGAAAREKIVHVLKDALCHPRIGGLLPTHYISSNCNNHCEGFKMPFSSERASSSSIAQIFSDIDDTLFPHAISWALRYCTSFSLALTFEVLSTNPDVCSCTNNSNAT